MINLLKYLKTLFERQLLAGESFHDVPLCVMDDKVFKKMLTSDTEDSREALRHLLSACTRREVTAVKILNSELLPVYIGAKTSVLDIRVNFNDGEAADIEMQIEKSEDNLKNRAAQYAAMLQSAQLRKGQLYKKNKRVYQIFFLNHILFPESSKLPRRYGYREEIEHDLLTDTTEIIFYEMPKIENLVKKYISGKIEIESLSNEEKWCIFFKYHHEKQAKSLIEELSRKEEGIMHAKKQVEKLPRSYIKYMTVEMDRMRANIDRMYMQKEAYDKGCAETDEKWQSVIADKDAEIAKLLAERNVHSTND